MALEQIDKNAPNFARKAGAFTFSRIKVMVFWSLISFRQSKHTNNPQVRAFEMNPKYLQTYLPRQIWYMIFIKTKENAPNFARKATSSLT